MPLMPAIRPMPPISSTAARPIRTPPKRPAQGVNSVTISLSLRHGPARAIAPPWPDLVIGVGRRSVPVARWIKAQSARRTAKLVQIGRPRAPLDWFDLVITTPQYRLPEAPNVLNLLLPALSVPALDPAERERWQQALFRSPAAAVDRRAGGRRARALPVRCLSHAGTLWRSRPTPWQARLGGSLLVTTSPRTGAAQARALARSHCTSRPTATRGSQGADNAHQAILALADRFIVTGDSVSMLAEACLTGKAVAIYEPPRHGLYPAWSGERGFGRRLPAPASPRRRETRRPWCGGWWTGGHASRLGATEPASFIPVPDERARLLAAIRTVVASA
jgi:uncharacterized protein